MIIQVQKLVLIFARISSFIVISPGFSYRSFPNIAKGGLSLSITMIMYFMTPGIQVTGDLLFYIILILKEVLFGLTIGFISSLFFSAMEIGGQLIDFQAGFSMSTVYDPTSGTKVSHYGRIYYWLSISIFFILNIHHRFLETLMDSFKYVPINSIEINNFGIEGIVKIFSIVFEIGFNLAVPMIIVILLTDILLGTISRTIPQINVLMLGMPMKFLASILIFLVLVSGLTNTIGKILNMTPGYMEGFIQQFK